MLYAFNGDHTPGDCCGISVPYEVNQMGWAGYPSPNVATEGSMQIVVSDNYCCNSSGTCVDGEQNCDDGTCSDAS